MTVNDQRSGCLKPDLCFFDFEPSLTPTIVSVDLMGESELIIGNILKMVVDFNQTLSDDITAFTGDAECANVQVTPLSGAKYEVTCEIGEVVYGDDHKIKFIV